MIYLDANATASLRPAAIAAVTSLLTDDAARNPSSVHSAGRRARGVVSEARAAVRALLQADRDDELFFTSGGTESCNTMVAAYTAGAPGHVICSAIEHPAVLEPVRRLERSGWQVSWIIPAADGIVDPQAYAHALRSDTRLSALMLANNETGAVQPVAAAAKLLREHGFCGAFVCDATQAVGKTPFSCKELFAAGVDAVAVSGHKLGAPSGIGALLLRGGKVKPAPDFNSLLVGGAQEGRRRAGTENVLGIAAFGAAARELQAGLLDEISRLTQLREDFWMALSQSVPGIIRLTPAPGSALSNTLSVRFPGCRGDDLVAALDMRGVAAATGSACASGKQEPSHVVAAMGYGAQETREVLRLSLDWNADDALVQSAVGIIADAVGTMRSAGTRNFGEERNAAAN